MLSRRPRTAGLIAAAALTTLAAAPAYAGAATSGSTTIDLKGAVARSLSSQQVRLSAQKPAKATAKRITLPVSGGTVATGATLKHGGSVTFRTRVRGRTRSAKLTAWETRVGSSRSSVSAKLGAKRITVFTIAAPKRSVAIDKTAGTARLTGGSVRLTAAGATALRRALALRRLAPGPLGSAKVSASVGAARRAPTQPGTSNPGTRNPGPTNPTDPNTPRAPPIATEPPVLARPAAAVNITGARLTWWVRDSWIAYLSGDNQAPAGTKGTSVSGATAQTPILAGQHLCKDDPRPETGPLSYAFEFPFKNGWYDEASGVAGVYFSGTVRFLRVDHGIDMTATDPEVEINGTSSRTIFRFDGGANTRLGNKRGPLTALDVARAPRTVDPATRTITYDPILGRLADGGADSFAGFYSVGSGYGCVQLSFTY
ncbi:HtaA domain-containing protein [Conexibacter woesei]|uniref:Htaa domain-containing protein n=1 Tax=Conexibacter woesei (strain DSM 14684 / CCUG 47730 / CIP 108061 / JCM 11494 / NBRC 100937 / ID131577) TaxID=469383 RepID=D3EZA3_CONWI|nr:HtaA domain-containing protein [Conexibacter woesei]ADB51868.1 hypothetical protein Cwoe_3450 [Conexibacter woesei DSM 14684]